MIVLKKTLFKKSQIQFFLKEFEKLNDQAYEIFVSDIKPGRSIQQNKYLRWIEKFISEETGDNPNDLHEIFIQKFSPDVFSIINTKEFKRKKRTHEFDTKEMTHHIDSIRLFCEEFFGFRVPEANELTDEELIKNNWRNT